MNKFSMLLASVLFATGQAGAQAPQVSQPPQASADISRDGTLQVGAKQIDYRTVAGTLTVRLHGSDDPAAAQASMFYVAYFKKGAQAAERPITFVYNGGPGSSTMWLHMGGFGPRRLLIDDEHHTAGPYKMTDNANSLLDVSDLVFIDAPGTGYGEVRGPKKNDFFAVDADAYAFGEFISGWLSKYGRWTSPKYLFGASYGTTRSAVLVNLLANEFSVDVNGVVLLDQILNWQLGSKGPQYNPGTDQAYVVALPTYAAVAWYHNRLPAPRPPDFEAFLRKVEQFATNDYALALQAGSTLDPARRTAVARQVSDFTGLPVDFVLRADLRFDSGQFRKTLLAEQGLTLGMCDGRYSGPDMDPLSKEADYLPDLNSIQPAHAAAINDYLRKTFGLGEDRTYKTGLGIVEWNFIRKQPPNAPTRVFGIANVMPDLAAAMKGNPQLKILVSGGYYDFCTAYFGAQYEMQHLPIPANLQNNIEYYFYPAGHWPYLHSGSFKGLRDHVADFIRRTDNLKH